MSFYPIIRRQNILRQSQSGEVAAIVVSVDSLIAIEVTETTITLDWAIPIGGTNPIQNYKIILNGAVYDTTTTDEGPWTVTGLTSGTEYQLNIVTVDSLGNESGLSNTVTESTEETAIDILTNSLTYLTNSTTILTNNI